MTEEAYLHAQEQIANLALIEWRRAQLAKQLSDKTVHQLTAQALCEGARRLRRVYQEGRYVNSKD